MEVESNKNLPKPQGQNARVMQVEVPSIRLTPEQIEEIHADEYSLTLFYATRVEPLNLKDIKREYPEPEPKKAQAVMDRFLKVGLVHINPDGIYHSNYPENYINYSHYRYDGDLEARKDAKVFQLMKEFTGKLEYWKDKTYFSMDAFYSKDQSDELLEMFKAIKLKAKEFANENAKKKSIRGLKFRRIKFYDMTFSLLFVLLFAFGFVQKSFAGGNDPVIKMLKANSEEALNFLAAARFSGGGGNDPTVRMKVKYYSNSDGGGGHDPDSGVGANNSDGGGGHDPDDPSAVCHIEYKGQNLTLTSDRSCKLKRLIDFINWCSDSNHPLCIKAEQQADQLIQSIESESRI